MPGKRGRDKHTRRNLRQREEKPSFLLSCEGKSEIHYFTGMREAVRQSIVVQIVPFSKESNPSRVVERAEDKAAEGVFNEVWCVIDRDDHEDFDHAIHQAHKQGFEVAYSNECFELWLLLHFEKPPRGTPRVRYIERLRHHLQRDYEKSLTEIHRLISPRQEEAVRRAKELFKDNEDAKAWAGNNPSTTIHLLLQNLEGNKQ